MQSLEELKARGDAAIANTRLMIENLRRIAAESARGAREFRRPTQRFTVVLADNAKNRARELLG